MGTRNSFAARVAVFAVLGASLLGLPLLTPTTAAASTTTIAFSFSPAYVPAGVGASSTATATVSINGLPAANQLVTFGAPSGFTVAPAAGLTNSQGQVTTRAASTAGNAGTYYFSASSGTAKGVGPLINYGPATSMMLSLSANHLPADGSSASTATVALTDAGGDGVPGQSVRLGTSGTASIGSVSDAQNGTYTANIVASTTPDTETLTATAGSLSSQQVLTVFGAPVTMSVALQYARISPNGTATDNVTATVLDGGGRGVSNQTVMLATSGDDAFPSACRSSCPTTNNGDGTYMSAITASMTQPPSGSHGLHTITGSASPSSLQGSASLRQEFPQSFTTSGNAIYDDLGRKITLRGIAGIAMEGSPVPDQFNTKVNVDHMAEATFAQGDGVTGQSWGANVVRVMLNEAFWLSNDTADKCGATYRQNVENAVNWITNDGMIALLDLHYVTTDGTTPCPSTGGAALQPMADAVDAPIFWSQVAADPNFKNNPLVAFELYNEPYLTTKGKSDGYARDATLAAGQSPADVWLNATPNNNMTVLNPPGPAYQAVGMQYLYNTVRTAGATNNLIVIDGAGPTGPDSRAAYDVSPALTTPVVGTNIVYSSHPYTTDLCVSGSSTTLPSDIDSKVAPVAVVYPVMFSEFGADCSQYSTDSNTHVDYDPFMRNVVNYAENHGMGWIAWQWLPANDSATNPGSLCGLDGNGIQEKKCEYGIFWSDTTDWKQRIPWSANPRGQPVLAQLMATPSSLN
jgi:aryl-phospho-beta-D-glucosidase BglC (GH1 family)